jgi:hypothetical protein
MFLLALCIILAIQIWTWNHLAQQVASAKMTKIGAIGRYTLWASVPMIIYFIVFFGAVGFEEWLGLALIPEPLARATIPILAVLLGSTILGSLFFAIRSTFLKW